MEELQIFSIDGKPIDVDCIYYFSNNNYYLIYTTREIDENGYVVLNITKIAREVINTDEGMRSTGNLVGLEITDDNEWKSVQIDINNIINDKKNKTSTIHYLPASSLINLKINGFRVFRLRPDILKEAFGIVVNDSNDDQDFTEESNQEFMDYKTKYLDSIDKIRELENEINDYKQKIEKIKKVLE